MLQKKLFVSLLLLSSSFMFSSNAARRPYDCEAKVAEALEKFERERYNDAKTILADVKYNCSGHRLMDSALYYLGMAYLRSGAYMDARIEFERLIQDYPRSEFQQEAHFRLGYATFLESNPPQKDQTKTKEAIREFGEFIEEFPRSPYADTAAHYLSKAQEKLAEKMLMNAGFYEKIERYESAVVYYRILLEEYPRSAFVSEARIRLAEALVKGNRYADAGIVLSQILESDVPNGIKRKARRLQKRIRREPPVSEAVEGTVEGEASDSGTGFSPALKTVEKNSAGEDTPEQETLSTDTAQGSGSASLDSVEADTAVSISPEEVDLPAAPPVVVDTDPKDSLMRKDTLEKLESDDSGTVEAEVTNESNKSVVVDSITEKPNGTIPESPADVDSVESTETGPKMHESVPSEAKD